VPNLTRRVGPSLRTPNSGTSPCARSTPSRFRTILTAKIRFPFGLVQARSGCALPLPATTFVPRADQILVRSSSIEPTGSFRPTYIAKGSVRPQDVQLGSPPARTLVSLFDRLEEPLYQPVEPAVLVEFVCDLNVDGGVCVVPQVFIAPGYGLAKPFRGSVALVAIKPVIPSIRSRNEFLAEGLGVSNIFQSFDI